MCEDAGLIQHPLLLPVLVVDDTQVGVGLLPGLAAGNALLQSLAAALHKAVKYVIQGELCHTAFYDVTTNLCVYEARVMCKDSWNKVSIEYVCR